MDNMLNEGSIIFEPIDSKMLGPNSKNAELPKIKKATGISDKSKTQLYDVALRIRNAVPKNQTLKDVNQGPKKVDLKAERPTTKLVGKAEQNVRDTKKENKYNDIFSRLRTT